MLSNSHVTALRALAVSEGVDPDALVAVAEGAAGDAPATEGPMKFDRLLLGHLPYMTVNEIRESIGLPSLPDGGRISGEWLLDHGGSDGGSTPAQDG